MPLETPAQGRYISGLGSPRANRAGRPVFIVWLTPVPLQPRYYHKPHADVGVLAAHFRAGLTGKDFRFEVLDSRLMSSSAEFCLSIANPKLKIEISTLWLNRNQN